VNITVRAENRPPVAVVTSPTEGARLLAERPISFDGSASLDPEGGTLRFVWQTNRTVDPIGDRDRFTIKLPVGRYRVTLSVYDLAGASGNATINVSVITDVPPSLSGGSVTPPVGPEGRPGGFAFRVTYKDPDDDPPQEVLVKVGHAGAFTAYAMGPEDHSATGYRAGRVYVATVPLTAGAHEYVFSCRDPFFSCATALFEGPQVYLVETIDISAVGARVTVNWTERGSVSVLRAAPPSPPPAGVVVISTIVRFDLVAGAWSEARASLRYEAGATIDPSTIGLWRFDAGRGLWVPASGQHDDGTRVEGDLPGGGVFAVLGAISYEHQNKPPVLHIKYDSKDAYVDRPLQFDATCSTDPDSGVLLFYWSFGDAPGGAGSVWVPGERVTHLFKGPGVYEVVLRALDGQNEVQLARNVSIRKYQAAAPGPLDNPGVLFVMGALLLLAFVLAVSNRIRLSRPEGYGAAIGGATHPEEEGEYDKLFRKLTEDELRGRPSEGPGAVGEESDGTGDGAPGGEDGGAGGTAGEGEG
jgi:hypothetical protein